MSRTTPRTHSASGGFAGSSAPTVPTIGVQQETAAPGGALRIVGSGLTGSNVTLRALDASGAAFVLGTTTVANGTIDASTISVPAGAAPGPMRIEADGAEHTYTSLFVTGSYGTPNLVVSPQVSGQDLPAHLPGARGRGPAADRRADLDRRLDRQRRPGCQRPPRARRGQHAAGGVAGHAGTDRELGRPGVRHVASHAGGGRDAGRAGRLVVRVRLRRHGPRSGRGDRPPRAGCRDGRAGRPDRCGRSR